jgi:hypothetical protein
METLNWCFSWFLHLLYINCENVQYADSTFLRLLAESKSDVFIPISSMNRVVISHHRNSRFPKINIQRKWKKTDKVDKYSDKLKT